MIFYDIDTIVGSHTQTSRSGEYKVQILYIKSRIGFSEKTELKTIEDCEKIHDTLAVEAIVRLHSGQYVASRRTSPSHSNYDELKYNIYGRNTETRREYYNADLTPHESHLAVLNFASKWLKK